MIMKEHRVIAFYYLTIHPIGFLASGKNFFFEKKFFFSNRSVGQDAGFPRTQTEKTEKTEKTEIAPDMT